MSRYKSSRDLIPDPASRSWGRTPLELTALRDILDQIANTKREISNQDLVSEFPGNFAASRTRDELTQAFDAAQHLLGLGNRIHREVIQNIDGKLVQAMNDVLVALDQVNEGRNLYRTEGQFEVTRERTFWDEMGQQHTITYTRMENLTLDQILNSSDTPIHAAQLLFNERLELINELIASGAIEDGELIEQLQRMSNDELVRAFFPVELGQFTQLRSTWFKDNAGWLRIVDIVLTVVVSVALVAAAILTGGLALVLAGAAIAYFVVRAGFGLITGVDMFSGRVLSTSDHVWAVATAVMSIIPGLNTALSVKAKLGGSFIRAKGKLGDVINRTRTTVANINKFNTHVRRAQHFYTAITDDNPLLALVLFGAAEAIGCLVKDVVNRMNTNSINQNLAAPGNNGAPLNNSQNIANRNLQQVNNALTRQGHVSFSNKDLRAIGRHREVLAPGNNFRGISSAPLHNNPIPARDMGVVARFDSNVNNFNNQFALSPGQQISIISARPAFTGTTRLIREFAGNGDEELRLNDLGDGIWSDILGNENQPVLSQEFLEQLESGLVSSANIQTFMEQFEIDQGLAFGQ